MTVRGGYWALTTRPSSSSTGTPPPTGKQISTLSDKLQEVREEEEQQRDQLLHCQTLANIAWSEIDVGALLTRISDLTKQIEEESCPPDLAEMDARIAAQEAKHRTAQKRESDERAQYRVVHRDLGTIPGV